MAAAKAKALKKAKKERKKKKTKREEMEKKYKNEPSSNFQKRRTDMLLDLMTRKFPFKTPPAAPPVHQDGRVDSIMDLQFILIFRSSRS